MPKTTRSLLLRYSAAVASVVLATLARWLIDPALGDHLPFVTFFVAVLFTAWYGGFGPSLVAVVFGALAATYFFVPPRGNLVLPELQDQVGLALYFFVGLASALFSEAMQAARRRAEASALETARQREWLKVTLSSIGEAVIATDKEGRVASLNPVAEALTGWRQTEAAGHPLEKIFNIVSEQTRQPVESPVAKVLREGTVVGLANHTVLIAKDGSERPIDDSAAPIRNEKGEVVGVVLIFRDVTERRRAEQDLQMQARVLESMAEGVSVADENGVILYTNPAEDRMFGYGPGEMLGQPVTVLNDYPPDENARRVAEAIGRLNTEGVWLGEWDNRRKDGTPFTTYARITALEAGGRRYFVCVHEDITERKKARAALEESEQRFRGLMEQAPFSIQIFSPDGRTVRVNRAWEGLWGVTPDQIGDYSILEDRQLEAKGVLPLIRRAFAGEPVHIPAIEYDPNETLPDITRHQDPRRWTSGVVYPLKDTAGRVREVVVVHEDITARIRAEEALRESEEKFRLLADTIPQLAWMARPDGHIFWYNRRWYEYTGTTPEQMEGWGWQSVHDPEALPKVLERWKRSIASGEPFDMVFPLRGADGRFRPFLTRINPLRDDEGRILYWFGTNTDISEQQRAEEASRFLADASATLAAVVDYRSTLQKVAVLAVPRFGDWCAVDVVGPDGSLGRLAVAHVDPAKVQLAHELDRRYPPAPNAPVGAPHVARTGEPEISEDIPDSLLEAAARDGEHLRLLRELGLKSYLCVPMKARGKVLGVLTFIAAESGRRYCQADLALAEELAGRAAVAVENARLYAQLREADRKKDEFLAVLGHELRNPLAPISNALHVLKLPGANGHVVEQAREMMERQVQHMVRLVDDLLDVSRIVRGKVELRKEPVELATVVTRAVETSQPLVEAEGHELTVALPPEPLRVSGDLVRLAQVVGNLLNNAARYTERGGKIRVEGERVGDRAVLRVRDTGIGIAADVLPRIWDMFVQADRRMKGSHGGMGIGLALVRGLVELHGGTVEARSGGPGKGSEFAVTLPLLPPKEADERQQEDGPSRQGASRRVLVVDDNVDAAESLAMLLRLGGHEVRVAFDGLTALKLAEAEPPEVAFLDIGMPVMDGYQLASRFKESSALQNVLLVALTGWGQEEDRRRTKEAGFGAHEVKPVSPEALADLLSHPKLARRERP